MRDAKSLRNQRREMQQNLTQEKKLGRDSSAGGRIDRIWMKTVKDA